MYGVFAAPMRHPWAPACRARDRRSHGIRTTALIAAAPGATPGSRHSPNVVPRPTVTQPDVRDARSPIDACEELGHMLRDHNAGVNRALIAVSGLHRVAFYRPPVLGGRVSRIVAAAVED
jgi:hypothetical protein